MMSLIKHKLSVNACKHLVAVLHIKWYLFTVTSKPRVFGYFWLAQLDFIFVTKCQLKLEILQIKTKGPGSLLYYFQNAAR